MSTFLEIPLSPQPQKLRVTLNGVQYRLRLTWCDPASCWLLDIDDQSGNGLLHGAPLVTGVDLLSQFEYLLIGAGLRAYTDHAVNTPPTFENLGVTSHLVAVLP